MPEKICPRNPVAFRAYAENNSYVSEGVGVRMREYQVSVRHLVEFVLRTGDLGSGSGRFPSRKRAQEGSRAHRKLQKTRPGEYEPEVAVSHRITHPRFILTISGRIDGVWPKAEGILLEEIKTVTAGWDYQPDPLHWAQIKVYGWFYCLQKELTEIELQLTYLSLETEQITVFREKYSMEVLVEFGKSVSNQYFEWIQDYDDWITHRNHSIATLPFPYGGFRKGQRELCRIVYKTIVQGGNLFSEAPTGIGKTISVLFPAIKALPVTTADRIFFLTARNTTQELARNAISDLGKCGLGLRSITLSAKEKLCVIDGVPCDPVNCGRSKGYLDRRKPAIQEALRRQQITRETLEDIAARHNVCAHELSLDISEWVDAIICDYNYAFDPQSRLKRHFGEESGSKVLLIDEAHNLVDRGREMFSAQVSSADFTQIAVENATLNRCARAARRAILAAIEEGASVAVSTELPQACIRALGMFVEALETFFAERPGMAAPEPLLDVYFRVLAFLGVGELFGPNYRTIVERDSEEVRVRLYCIDPAPCLREAIKGSMANVFFSATLTPTDYFRQVLGGSEKDANCRLASPFPPGNLQVLIAPNVKTGFRHRASSYGDVARMLEVFVGAKPGNYLVFFPSYAYLNEVSSLVQQALPTAQIVIQTGSMDDASRKTFLDRFYAQQEKLVIGFAVMGGIFGEGIDLVGDRLIGVAVIGPGLPQVSLERDLIRNHFDEKSGDGFECAYLFPGLNRVLQAAGRLIRSEHDRGVVLLVDSRFAEQRIYSLLPEWWPINVCRDESTLKQDLDHFWKTTEMIQKR